MHDHLKQCIRCSNRIKEVPINQQKTFQVISRYLDYMDTLKVSIDEMRFLEAPETMSKNNSSCKSPLYYFEDGIFVHEILAQLNKIYIKYSYFFTHYLCPNHKNLDLLYDINGDRARLELMALWKKFEKIANDYNNEHIGKFELRIGDNQCLSDSKYKMSQHLMNYIKVIHKFIEICLKIQEKSIRLSTAMALITDSSRYIEKQY